MIYEEKKDKIVYIYDVTYDKEKLKDILEKLKKYSYTLIRKENMCGSITRWPTTKKNIQKRVSSNFYSRYWNSENILLPETIIRHTENDFDYVTYEYLFEKLPDLYSYIDIVINNRNIMKYADSFGYGMGNLTMNYMFTHRDQLVLEGLLNYINSQELVNHNLENYDYKGLNELYKETLECFKFNLVAIKEYLDNQEIVSGLLLQKKK